ncbi:hypothetical protein JCM3774_001677 [Rhodotorula dairenensis]
MLSLPLDSYASTSAVTLEALAALSMHVASDRTKVVFAVGAGISTAAGIPDFRGGCGSLYGGSSSRYPTPTHSTTPDARLPPTRTARRTKQLFYYDALLRPESRAEHFALMVDLKKAAKRAIKRGNCRPDPTRGEAGTDAAPTAFHGLMRGLADRGRLARVYTQNVDGLEAAAGLLSAAPRLDPDDLPPSAMSDRDSIGAGQTSPRRRRATPPPTVESIPGRDLVVTLHGTLDRVTCSICHHTAKWKKCHTIAFKKGRAKKCPICYGRARSRKLESKRTINPSRLAFLRPAVVLYDDPSFAASSAANHISWLADADLADGPTCLIVAGTSLRIPGFRSLVKNFSRAVREHGGFCVLVNREAVGKEWDPFFDYHFIGETEVFAQHLANLLDAFLPALDSPPAPATVETVGSPSEHVRTLEPVSRISLPPTPPPSSSPLATTCDLPLEEDVRHRPRDKRVAFPPPPPRRRDYPGKKRPRSVDPCDDLSPTKGLEPGPAQEEQVILHPVSDSDPERAAAAAAVVAQEVYLSPPPSSLPDPGLAPVIIPLAGCTPVHPPAQNMRSDPHANEKKRKRGKRRRLEQLCIAEVLRRADKYQRKLDREAERDKQAQKKEKRRRRGWEEKAE